MLDGWAAGLRLDAVRVQATLAALIGEMGWAMSKDGVEGSQVMGCWREGEPCQGLSASGKCCSPAATFPVPATPATMVGLSFVDAHSLLHTCTHMTSDALQSTGHSQHSHAVQYCKTFALCHVIKLLLVFLR